MQEQNVKHFSLQMLLPDHVEFLLCVLIFRFLTLKHLLLALGQHWCLKDADVDKLKHELLYLPTHFLRVKVSQIFKVDSG